MAMMFQVQAFRFVTPCSVVAGHQRFRGPCCLFTTTLHGVKTQKTLSWNTVLLLQCTSSAWVIICAWTV